MDRANQLFSPDRIDIPYRIFTLDNGLRLVVHEDHKAPIVAVNVWYHVGAKNEPPGKTGFAHLFEHLMFNGSEHFNDDYFQALQAIGATELNGTTSHDRTNYFQNVPTAALDQVLWLESDRMGHLLGAIDQDKLDEQRGVVKNEKRQKEDQPYGKQWELITKEMYPPGHPYSWTVIGSMEDLDGATVEDVHEWFRAYYGAANAVLVVAGDVDPDEVFEKVQHYFGDIPPGPPIVRPGVNIPVRPTDTRMSYTDRVPEARIVMTWNTPQLGTRADAMLSLAASILTSGKNALLYRELVYERRLASDIAAFQWSKEIAGNFIVQANVRPGQSSEEVETALNDLLTRFLTDGPNQEEVGRARAQYFAGLIKGSERIGGFGGKSDILASSTVFGGSPDAWKQELRYISEATPEEIRAVCARWLDRGRFTLVCHPLADHQHLSTGADRAKMPGLSKIVPGRFPELERTSLSNGFRLIVGRRPNTPTVAMSALFEGGFAADQAGHAGRAKLAMELLDEGTETSSALDINRRLQMLGASMSSGATLDASYLSMNALHPALMPSIELFCEIMTSAVCPEHEFTRLQQAQLDDIQREKSVPTQMALRVLPALLYGVDHPYGLPMTGSGYTETVARLQRQDVLAYYDTWIAPNNTTLIVVGDVAIDQLSAQLEAALSTWQTRSSKQILYQSVAEQPGNTLYVMDRPGSEQSVIIGGYLIAPYGAVSEIGLEAVNNVLGGQFISRINLNLREDKHWTYGAGSFIAHARGQRPLVVYAPVQWDRTAEAIREIRKEMTDFAGPYPMTGEEFEKNKANTVLRLPGKWETNAAVAASVGQIVKYGLPDDYFQHYPDEVNALALEDVHALSKQLIDPERLQWLVVGDTNRILDE
ncbi:MAG: pitrilysin family protein, partial [Saprospiraceae bacterium]|nr:pitrilysin family protein [Saprospiraceae bacterium]